MFPLTPEEASKLAGMADEVLPASLEKLEIDLVSSSLLSSRDVVSSSSTTSSSTSSSTSSLPSTPSSSPSASTSLSSNCSRVSSNERLKATNPFRITSSKNGGLDCSYLFRRRSMPNRPVPSIICPRGVKTTTNFKPPRNERTQETVKKNSIIKEAVLQLGNSDANCLSYNLAETFLEQSCRLSISSRSCKTFGHGSVTKDFKALNISQDGRQVKDDTSIQDDFQSGSFQRARSNTMPSLKRGPGPGGGSNTQPPDSVVGLSGQSANTNTCSAQARISPPSCDITIDELASYFEEFVHIPKKMSHMAEMMYI